jgi:5-methylcytosine-specific restriction endonuclease McrA
MARYHSRTAYQKYLMSRRWLEHPARLAEFKAADYRCRICNAAQSEVGLEAHHRTYERFGNEGAGDLTALCRDCHRAVTDYLRRRRYGSRRIKTVNFQGALESSFELIDPIARKVRK